MQEFTSKRLGIVVSRDSAGSISWSGNFEGRALRAVAPLEGGAQCVLLLDPDSSKQPVFENLLCINKEGDVVWTAKLPDSPDAFVRISLEGKMILANSWSGFLLKLDAHTGKEIERVFVK